MLCYLSLNTKAFRDHRSKRTRTKIGDENENHSDEASINQTAIDLNMPIEIRYVYIRQRCVSRSNCFIPSLWIKLITILWKCARSSRRRKMIESPKTREKLYTKIFVDKLTTRKYQSSGDIYSISCVIGRQHLKSAVILESMMLAFQTIVCLFLSMLQIKSHCDIFIERKFRFSTSFSIWWFLFYKQTNFMSKITVIMQYREMQKLKLQNIFN